MFGPPFCGGMCTTKQGEEPERESSRVGASDGTVGSTVETSKGTRKEEVPKRGPCRGAPDFIQMPVGTALKAGASGYT